MWVLWLVFKDYYRKARKRAILNLVTQTHSILTDEEKKEEEVQGNKKPHLRLIKSELFVIDGYLFLSFVFSLLYSQQSNLK